MKKISFLSFFFLMICLFLIGCEEDKKTKSPILSENIEMATIYKMVSFSEVEEDSLIEITNPDDIKILEEAFRSAVKQDGSVDMSDPHYKINFGKDAYYLWIAETSGTIMNLIDTHTIYTLSDLSTQSVFELIDGSYNDNN